MTRLVACREIDLRICPAQIHGLTRVLARQRLCAAGNLDRIRVLYADALEEFLKRQVKSVIETPENGRVALITLARTFEIKNLLHDGPPALA